MLKTTDEKVCPNVGETQEEIWEPVMGFEGLYEVSNRGRVKNLPRFAAHPNSQSGFRHVREKILKLHKDRYGYYRVDLRNLGKKKTLLVHRLIGYAFLGLTDQLCIDHKNGIRGDNRLENLRVVTHGENSRSYAANYGISKYRGVSPSEYKNNSWMAMIAKNGKRYYLGRFETEKEAAEAYNEKALELGFNKEALNMIKER